VPVTNLDRISERAMQQSLPLSALFELTGRCNLDCGHCYLDIANPPDELSTDEALHVIDELKRAGTLFLTLTGGEIFLRKDVLIIAAHARRLGMAVRLFTNATRITRELAREIAAIKPLGVEISIYGAHASEHASVTSRASSLRRTLRGVVHLKRAGVNIQLKAPLLSAVVDQIDGLFSIADRLGVPLRFDPLVTPRHDNLGNAPLVMRAEGEALIRAFQHPRLKQFTQRSEPRDPDDIPCALARRTTRVSPTGDVFACPSYPGAIGNLLERSFRDIWSGGELLDRLRKVRVRDLEGDCHDCSQSGYCGRCTAVALLEHGDEMGPTQEACRVADAKDRAVGVEPVRSQSSRLHLRVVRG
jgi:radical SAM protein with 4Fe4S-binding SPASM domain